MLISDMPTDAVPISSGLFRAAPRNIVLSPAPATFNVTCYGFHLWAEDFLAAEKLYAPTARTGSFPLKVMGSMVPAGSGLSRVRSMSTVMS